jgi:acetyl esterase
MPRTPPPRFGTLDALRTAPPAGARALPTLVWLHGGKFTDGRPEDALALAEALSDLVEVWLPAYPLAPAQPFPAALDALFEGLRALPARNGLLIGGERAGGNLAAALALRARDEGLRGHGAGDHAFDAQILLAPLLDPSQNTPSMRAAGECPCAPAWRAYLSQSADGLHPYAAPLFASRLQRLPNTLILTGDRDPARDEAVQYAERLRLAGVPVDLGRLSYPPLDERERAATTADAARLIRAFIDTLPARRRTPRPSPRRRASPASQTDSSAIAPVPPDIR